MFTVNEYVPANQIWSTAKSYEDMGYIDGYVRGYNVEVQLTSGKTEWLSCEWISGNPEVYFNDDFHKWYNAEHQWNPTGRVSFRGYGVEIYDHEERDFVVEIVDNPLA